MPSKFPGFETQGRSLPDGRRTCEGEVARIYSFSSFELKRVKTLCAKVWQEHVNANGDPQCFENKEELQHLMRVCKRRLHEAEDPTFAQCVDETFVDWAFSKAYKAFLQRRNRKSARRGSQSPWASPELVRSDVVEQERDRRRELWSISSETSSGDESPMSPQPQLLRGTGIKREDRRQSSPDLIFTGSRRTGPSNSNPPPLRNRERVGEKRPRPEGDSQASRPSSAGPSKKKCIEIICKVNTIEDAPEEAKIEIRQTIDSADSAAAMAGRLASNVKEILVSKGLLANRS